MFYEGEVLENRYQIIREIGEGGTGVIYLGWHMHLQKEVVIKKIKDEIATRINVRAEVDILKKLHYTGLPQVYDYVEIGSETYTVMEYIPGNDFQYYMNQGYRFSEKDLLSWFIQLSAVLDYLHSFQPRILHSDIKPGNIMLTPEGKVYLIDFNISLDGQQRSVLNGISSNYAAPEQYYDAQILLGRQNASLIPLDGRMDIYSLGAVFYSLISGIRPTITAEQPYPIMQLDVPYSDGFKTIIDRCMKWNPNERFATAADLQQALVHLYKFDHSYRKFKYLHIATCVISSVLLILGIWSCFYGSKLSVFDRYEDAYETFLQACDTYKDDEILQQALKILNNTDYQSILDEKQQDKAYLFNQTGNVCFAREDYTQAFEYFQRAKEADASESVYFRNASIAAARKGDISQAKMILSEAKEQGIVDNDLLLAEQEIAFLEQDYAKVLEKVPLLESYADSSVLARCYLLAAKACAAIGDSENQLFYLEKADAMDGDIRNKRELGQVYLEEAQRLGNGYAAKKYLAKSESCFKELWTSQYASASDGLNLAITYELEENYRDGMAILQLLDNQGVELYQVYMHMAYINIKTAEQAELNGQEANYQNAWNYYNKALRLYAPENNDPTMDFIKKTLQQKRTGQEP